MSRRSYLTPAGATGDSTLSKRNALLGSSSNGYSSSQTNFNDPDYSYGGHGYANNNSSRSPSPFVRPSSSNSAYASQRQAEDLEGQNDEELEGLGAKVKLLKDITINIGNEVRDQSKLLGSMNDAFDETRGFLSGTFQRMNKMAARQGGRWWYWMLFLILVFWIFVLRWLHII